MRSKGPWRRLARVGIAVVAICAAALGGAIAFGTAAAPPPLTTFGTAIRQIDFSDLPPVERYPARDGTALAYRAYPGDARRVAVLVHGSAGSGRDMHAAAKALQATGATVYALDVRGHGSSGRRGDIDYLGQLDDDVADFVASVLRTRHQDAAATLVGFSSGGGFALRIASGPNGGLFDRYILLSPYLRYDAPTNRSGDEQWARPYMPRIVGLTVLGSLGVHILDGLPVVAFAVPAGVRDLTPNYSWRLVRNFGPHRDYLDDFRRSTRPMRLIVGEADELFRADQFAPLLKPVRPDLAIEVLPGRRHLEMITHPDALRALQAAFTADD